METIGQRGRLVILVLYLGGLGLASELALGQIWPPSNEEGLWFFAGLGALLLGNLLVTPFFTAPADAISYSVSALIALLAVGVLSDTSGHLEILGITLFVYLTVVLAFGIGAIALRGATGSLLRILGSDFFRFCDTFGDARAVYSSTFLFAILAYHSHDKTEFAILLVTGIIVVTVQPFEYIATWIIRGLRFIQGLPFPGQVGELLARQEPGILLVRRNPGATMAPGDLVVARAADEEVLLGVHLDWQWLAGETWARIVRIPESVLRVRRGNG